MMLSTLQLRYQLYLLSFSNSTGMPVTCTANSNFLKQVEFPFKGTYKDNLGHAKVGAILNWPGDAAFEIYGNFMWTALADKDYPLKVLKVVEDYFKPAQNKYHCWCCVFI